MHKHCLKLLSKVLSHTIKEEIIGWVLIRQITEDRFNKYYYRLKSLPTESAVELEQPDCISCLGGGKHRQPSDKTRLVIKLTSCIRKLDCSRRWNTPNCGIILVSCQINIVGYNLFNFILASSQVKRQSTVDFA